MRVLGAHGALPEEKERAQPFELDVYLDADLALAGTTDALVDTIDYGMVVATAERVVAEERHRLLERLATRIADDVLALDLRITGVTVTVRKLRPPVPADLRSAGVTIHRLQP